MMAPIHHHFEKRLRAKRVDNCIRFWIIAIILALIGLATLKLGMDEKFTDFKNKSFAIWVW